MHVSPHGNDSIAPTVAFVGQVYDTTYHRWVDQLTVHVSGFASEVEAQSVCERELRDYCTGLAARFPRYRTVREFRSREALTEFEAPEITRKSREG